MCSGTFSRTRGPPRVTPSMKPQRAKRSNSGMQFFTPELLAQVNSTSEEQVERGQEAWENAIKRYHQHLSELHESMPSAVLELSELDLHDWELVPVSEGRNWAEALVGTEPMPFWRK